MQKYQVNAMTVSRKDFEQELEKVGLKFGYIPRLYEKFKQGEITVFSTLQKNTLFYVFTDDESSYPEIQEETGKKIEEYSLEWLDELIYNTKLAGPISSEALLLQLEMYLRVNKAKQCDETRKQDKCPYCHEVSKQVCGFEKFGDEFYIARIMPDRSMKKEKAKFCPECGRKLEE